MTRLPGAERSPEGIQLNPRIGNLDRRLFFAYVACSLAAIFYLPGFVPVQPATAQSYVFGYNNKAGVVILMLCLVLGAFWTGGLNFQRSSAADSRPVSRKVLLWSLAGMSFGCLAMYLFAGRFGGFRYFGCPQVSCR